MPRLISTGLLMAACAYCENVWKSADLDNRLGRTTGVTGLHSGPGYTIRLRALGNRLRSQGEPFDQMLWIRRGRGRLGLVANAEFGSGDLVRIPRGVAHEIEPLEGRVEFVAIEIKPLAPGKGAPIGIRPARGEMGHVLRKPAIDAVIARTQANAPLHTQDNFTANFVLFKGRVGPWESHTNCADIYLLQSGTGAIQLGGTIENAKEDSPGEPRGTGMKGSRDSVIGAGDLAVIPRGLAHHNNPETLPLAYVLIKVWSE